MSNDKSLIYLLVSLCFKMFIFGILETWKCDFFSFVNESF